MAVIGGIESVQLDRVTSRNGTRSLIGYSNVVKGMWPGQQTFVGSSARATGFFSSCSRIRRCRLLVDTSPEEARSHWYKDLTETGNRSIKESDT